MRNFLFLFLSFITLYGASQTITTVAGNGFGGYAGDGGPATSASIWSVIGICVDGTGNLYIADQANNRIRKVNTSGIISTIAGTGVSGSLGDGGLATNAQLSNPWGITTNGLGDFYIADLSNNKIRKINSSGIISTIAGNGTLGFSGDGGPATLAQLAGPSCIALDAFGNIYFTDTYNSRIRKIDQAGIITTIAGTVTSGYSGDGGPAIAAELNNPSGIVSDGSGNIVFTDGANNVVRKISTSGIITTVAGNGNPSYSGDGGIATAAEMNGPIGLTRDQFGNLYIGDTFNQRVRMVNTAGIITTIAGTGVQGFSGDGGSANMAKFSLPAGIAMDGAGNIYVADTNNDRVRKISSMVGIHEFGVESSEFVISPNPNNGSMNVNLNGSGYTNLKVKDVLGQEIYSEKLDPTESDFQLPVDISKAANGIYFLEINKVNAIQVKKIIKE